MPSSYTSSLRLTLPATGELSGTWGSTVNDGVTSLTDSAIAGTATVSMTDADYTLTTANGATDEARRMFIRLTGGLTASRNVICPAVSKLYFVYNNTSGGQNIVFKTSAGSGITVPNGARMVLYCNGTDVVEPITNLASGITLGGNLVVNGNTTLGDASTDTVTVNGYMGVGGAPSATASVFARGTALTGVNQYGVYAAPTGSSGATTSVNGVTTAPATAAAAFTAASVYGLRALDATKGAGSTITDLHGIRVDDQTQGTNNYGITSLVSSGSNKWNIYASGTAANYFAGNVGIGTSTPQTQLELSSNNGAGTALNILRFNDADLTSSPDQPTGKIEFYINDATAGGTGVASYIMGHAVNTAGGGYLTFATSPNGATGATERVRLDSAGNLGIGVTPSGWSGLKAIQFGDSGAVSSSANFAGFSANAYFTTSGYGGATYIQSRYAQMYLQSPLNGSHVWYTAPSGTAGNAITFTQAMTLSAAGGLSIGDATDPGAGGLRITGNATLGTASTDTVTVNGYMGVGGAGSSNIAIRVQSNALTGTDQYGVASTPTSTSSATGSIRSIYSAPATAALAFTVADVAGFWAANATKGAGSTITNQHGVYIVDQTQGTNNYGVTSLVSSGTNKWNIYASGTAANYFAGNVQFAAGAVGTPSLTRFGDDNTGFWFPAADTIAASTGGSERLRLDSSGNLGLGVTPSAWGSGITALEMPNSGFLAFANSSGNISTNTYFDTAYKYKATAAAARYGQAAGAHTWFTAPSGTAGNAITFTQAMTLDASGFLGLGVTPSDWSSTWDAFQFGARSSIATQGTVTDISYNVYRNPSNVDIYIGTDYATRYRQQTGEHRFYTAASGTAGTTATFTQVMTLDASGNLFLYQPAPAAVNATATLTVANLQTRIITSTTAAAVTGTLPTGTLMDGWFSGATDMAVDWTVINTGATNNFTVALGTGHSVVGNMVVLPSASGAFRSRRTAANTWITYRVS